MITLRRSHERGQADHGWLQSYHSFSFADYFDPAHVQFGALRVLNDDIVAPGKGFGMHGHQDMEIVTYMMAGALEHKDSMGNGSVIRSGDVQRMSAGSGVRHSEFNPSGEEAAHLLQIWLLPQTRGGTPSYEQKHFSIAERRGKLCLVAAGNKPIVTPGAVYVQQDAAIYAGLFDGDETAEHTLSAGRRSYVHVARGTASVNGLVLQAGDALLAQDERTIVISGGKAAELLLFDLA